MTPVKSSPFYLNNYIIKIKKSQILLMFVALSLVASTIVAIIAVVFSKLMPTDAAEEAVLLIAVASSYASLAVTAATLLYTSVTR